MRLEAAMDILSAEEELAGRYGPMADSRVYDLVLAITGDEERASAAQAERYAAVLRRGGTPEV